MFPSSVRFDLCSLGVVYHGRTSDRNVSGAGRKSGEPERSGEQTFQKHVSGGRAWSGGRGAGRRAGVTKIGVKSAAHAPLTCSAQRDGQSDGIIPSPDMCDCIITNL